MHAHIYHRFGADSKPHPYTFACGEMWHGSKEWNGMQTYTYDTKFYVTNKSNTKFQSKKFTTPHRCSACVCVFSSICSMVSCVFLSLDCNSLETKTLRKFSCILFSSHCVCLFNGKGKRIFLLPIAREWKENWKNYRWTSSFRSNWILFGLETISFFLIVSFNSK